MTHVLSLVNECTPCVFVCVFVLCAARLKRFMVVFLRQFQTPCHGIVRRMHHSSSCAASRYGRRRDAGAACGWERRGASVVVAARVIGASELTGEIVFFVAAAYGLGCMLPRVPYQRQADCVYSQNGCAGVGWRPALLWSRLV